jgi:histone H3/H4
MMDFAIMRRACSIRRSREALREMASIVQHFANQMGEHAAAIA